jgi:hypothetical protein
MGNAIWLITALPGWYLAAVAAPFSAGALTLVPAIGSVSLAVGLILGAIQRRRGLLLFLIPLVLSEGLVAIAGLLRGQVPSDSVLLEPSLLGFIAVQFAVAGYLIYRMRGARAAASAFSVFSVTYAAFGGFVAAMSFTDQWV